MIRDIVSLASSSVVGQVINLLVLLIVARIVSVDVYGGYAVCLTLVGYVSVLAGAKYHHVVFTGSKEESSKIVAGSYLFTCLLSVVGFVGLIFAKFFLNKLSEVSLVDLILITFAGFLSASNLFYYYLCLREDKLKTVFYSRLIPPLVGGFGMVSAAFFIGNRTLLVFFYTVTTLVSYYILKKNFVSKWSIPELISILKKYKSFPLFLLPAGVLEVFNSSFLLLATADLFGVQVSAAFGLYLRLVGSPQGLIVSSVGDTIRKKIVSLPKGHHSRILLRTGIALLGVALLGSVAIYLFANYGLVPLLGSKWGYAGQYFLWMLPVFVLSFVVPSLSVTLYVYNGQKYDLFLQVITALMYGLIYYWFKSDLSLFVLGFVTANCIKYIVELLLCVKCLKEQE
ncbi:lipopolysaccharide biosynthesis protein [Bdellovibrio bacteriovorus]|uniref:lipopolysaccharide biosynthesis protein n=1 Tax=Bdellovibrio bacteriovorus TaxID=959 RepID=UPI003D087F99